MTIKIRRASERGHANHGWLDTHHTFSFSEYQDPAHMGFSVLRVINEDRIEGGTGFETHPHRDMEIISYVLEGALEHRDTMGNKTVILPGEVQRMSAGTGVRHSEKNHLAGEKTHFYQIWILPDRKGYPPGYGQKSFSAALSKQGFVLAASKDGREGSITINQDADLYLGKLAAGARHEFTVRAGRQVWVQTVRGKLELEGRETLGESDGASISGAAQVRIAARGDCEFLLFDLP